MLRQLARAALAAPALLALLAVGAPAQPAAAPDAAGEPLDGAAESPPPVAREFRAAWVATVANIDWPSRPGLGTWEQQAELLAILNRAVALRLNAVIFQVRPSADALYPSRLEPWSEYLSGDMGRPPEPAWDPLAFAVAEAHRRGLELHAWINPFRARHADGTHDLAATHVGRSRPGIVRQYGRSLWMDPGDAATHAHSIAVVLDIVRRYDVDGVHIDDYFYPYRERGPDGRALDFPDSASWARYRRGGGTLPRDDWRRRNVDRFVQRMYAAVKGAKPWVKVGISPFGIWRPGHPAGVWGLDAYSELYADARKWAQRGWADYLAPQLYWPTAAPQQPFGALLEWWVAQSRGRHVWPGLFTSRVASPDAQWRAGEILGQIALTRAERGAGGNIHFSMKALMENRDGLADSLLAGAYAEPALVPASPWLDSIPPARPVAAIVRDTVAGGWRVSLRGGGTSGLAPWRWVVRARFGDAWRTTVLPGAERTHALTWDEATPPDAVVVTAVDRVGNESRPTTLRPGTRVIKTRKDVAP
jgi:uncharacterized lipoprotein YddW (UPF0748 family)